MKETREQLIDALVASQNQIVALLESVADDQDWQPAPQAWSFRYIAAHMLTTEEDAYRDRVTRIAAGENPQFGYYLNTGWDFSRFDLLDTLQKWAAARREILDFVRNLPPEKLALTGTHVKFGTITVLDALQLILEHDQEHLQELESLISRYHLEQRCRREVVELHQFFQDWYNGDIPPTGENFTRLANVLSDDFVIIGPDGEATPRAPLVSGLRQAHNSRTGFEIKIEQFRFHWQVGDIALATYQEWQSGHQSKKRSGRLSTVIFKKQPETPNGLAWLHVHETWLNR